MKKKNKLLIIFLVSIVLSFQTQLTYAASNNFLSVKIVEENNSLVIKEDWNVILKENGLFERELALDKNSITNISIHQKFPQKDALSFNKTYNTSDNTTTINVNTDTTSGRASALTLEYKLNLDNKTKEDFINNLPNSLSTENTYGIKTFALTLNTNEHNYSGQVNFDVNENFVQETSKFKTLEVLVQLFKLLINLVLLVIVCFISYIGGLAFYYRKIKYKNRRKQLKRIKSNKKISVSNKKNLLKTRI